MGIADNRPGYKLMKKADEHQKAPKRALGFDLAPIDINGIGKGLEGIKGDTYGQTVFGSLPTCAQKGIEVIVDKDIILKGR